MGLLMVLPPVVQEIRGQRALGMVWLPYLKPTLDPAPSITSQPTAISRDSILRHSNVRGGGSAKITDRVFLCALFMVDMILKMVSFVKWEMTL